MKEQRTRCSSH